MTGWIPAISLQTSSKHKVQVVSEGSGWSRAEGAPPGTQGLLLHARGSAGTRERPGAGQDSGNAGVTQEPGAL